MKTTILSLLILLSAQLFSQTTQWCYLSESNSALPDNSVKAITFENDNLWIGTINGLAKINNSNWDEYNTDNSDILDNYIRCISIDNAGGKWIGTMGGVVTIDNNPSQRNWTVYNTSNSGLPMNNITSVVVDNLDRKWFGTWGGGLVMFDGTLWTTYNMYNSNLPVNGIYDIKIDANGILWIATHGGGLVKYDGSSWQVYNVDNSNISSNIVYAIEFDNLANIWLGTEAGLVKFNGTNIWKLYNSYNTGWNFTSVNCLKFDKADEVLYFGTFLGLGVYSDGAFSFLKVSNSGLSSNWVSVINIDGDGNKWIGTLGGGISIYNENGVHVGTDDITVESDNVQFNIYPNPVSDALHITLNLETTADVVLNIFDSKGALVGSVSDRASAGQLKTIDYDISMLPRGSYICQLTTPSKVHIQRVLKIL